MILQKQEHTVNPSEQIFVFDIQPLGSFRAECIYIYAGFCSSDIFSKIRLQALTGK
jgi:hypothetical protein